MTKVVSGGLRVNLFKKFSQEYLSISLSNNLDPNVFGSELLAKVISR